jgi:hypothetical protein
MKKIITLISLLSTTIFANAQDDYQTAMQENIRAVDSVKDAQTLTGITATFAALYDAKKEWQPLYYECLGYIKLSSVFTAANEKKQAIDKAAALLDSLPAANDEVQVLRAWFAMQYMAVDRSTWQTYYPIMNAAMARAQALNADNPRLYYIKGILKYSMPATMGGSRDEGLKVLRQALEKFASYKPAYNFAPAWGKTEAEQYLAKTAVTGK